MKNSLLPFLLWMLLLWQPVETGQSQTAKGDTTLSKAGENEQLRIAILKKQQVISDLASQIPDKPKVVYIKIFTQPPKKKYAKDYLQVEPAKLKLLGIDSVSSTPIIKPTINKPSFFKRLSIRLFHHKKTK